MANNAENNAMPSVKYVHYSKLELEEESRRKLVPGRKVPDLHLFTSENARDHGEHCEVGRGEGNKTPGKPSVASREDFLGERNGESGADETERKKKKN